MSKCAYCGEPLGNEIIETSDKKAQVCSMECYSSYDSEVLDLWECQNCNDMFPREDTQDCLTCGDTFCDNCAEIHDGSFEDEDDEEE